MTDKPTPDSERPMVNAKHPDRCPSCDGDGVVWKAYGESEYDRLKTIWDKGEARERKQTIEAVIKMVIEVRGLSIVDHTQGFEIGQTVKEVVRLLEKK